MGVLFKLLGWVSLIGTGVFVAFVLFISVVSGMAGPGTGTFVVYWLALTVNLFGLAQFFTPRQSLKETSDPSGPNR